MSPRHEPAWVALFLAEIEAGKKAALSAELAGVTKQRVSSYAERHPSFQKRLFLALAASFKKKADRISA